MNFLFNINVCRVCMQNEQHTNLLKDKLLLEKFEFTTRLAISEKDNLPKSICTKCSTRLKVAYTFIKTAHESENNLKLFINKINTDFKEVSQLNKSIKNQSNEQNLTEDELLSLMDYDDCQKTDNDSEIKESLKPSSSLDYKDKKYKAGVEDMEDSNEKNTKIPKGVLKAKKDSIGDLKNQSVYHLTDDILLISENRNEIDNEFENNTDFMEISHPDEEEETETKHFTSDDQDNVIEQEKTESGTDDLAVHDEIECQSQSAELGVEDSEENPDYERLINSQVNSLNFPSIYVDENSTEDNNKEDTYYITHINEDVSDNLEEKSFSKESVTGEREETVTNALQKNYGNRFYCEKCNLDFSTKTNLNRHMQSHEGNKRFSCTECDKSFTQKSTLKQHMYTHTGERPYVCEVCNRGFTQCKSLIFHMRRHTGEKPFHCEYCLITFRQKDALRSHILKHHVVVEQTVDGINIFTCIICQKKFDTKNAFKTHMKAHTASAEVDNVSNYIKHEQIKFTAKKIIQTGNSDLLIPIDSECIEAAVVDVSTSSAAEPSRAKKFQCRKCFKCFALKKSLVRHMRLHISNNAIELSECLECDLQFSTNEMYQEHIVECHQYNCSYCPGIIFKTIDHLKEHMLEHDLEQQE